MAPQNIPSAVVLTLGIILYLVNIVLFCKHFQELIAENVWNIDLQVNQQKVTGVYGKRSIGETDLYVTCLDVYGKGP